MRRRRDRRSTPETAPVPAFEGVEESGTAVLNGRVVDGSLRGARGHAEFKVIDCGESEGPCFQGTISVKQRSEHEEDDDA